MLLQLIFLVLCPSPLSTAGGVHVDIAQPELVGDSHDVTKKNAVSVTSKDVSAREDRVTAASDSMTMVQTKLADSQRTHVAAMQRSTSVRAPPKSVLVKGKSWYGWVEKAFVHFLRGHWLQSYCELSDAGVTDISAVQVYFTEPIREEFNLTTVQEWYALVFDKPPIFGTPPADVVVSDEVSFHEDKASSGIECGNCMTKFRDHLAARLGAIPRSKRSLKISLLDRAPTAKRKILNMQGLSTSIARLVSLWDAQFESYVGEDKTPKQQVDTLLSTDVMISSHGTEFALAFLLPPRAMVVEIMPPGFHYCMHSLCFAHEEMLWVQTGSDGYKGSNPFDPTIPVRSRLDKLHSIRDENFNVSVENFIDKMQAAWEGDSPSFLKDACPSGSGGLKEFFYGTPNSEAKMYCDSPGGRLSAKFNIDEGVNDLNCSESCFNACGRAGVDGSEFDAQKCYSAVLQDKPWRHQLKWTKEGLRHPGIDLWDERGNGLIGDTSYKRCMTKSRQDASLGRLSVAETVVHFQRAMETCYGYSSISQNKGELTTLSQKQQCPSVVDLERHFGLWIDGRNAAEGPYAYSESYAKSISSMMQNVWWMAEKVQSEDKLQMETVLAILGMTNQTWRHFHNPGCSESCESIMMKCDPNFKGCSPDMKKEFPCKSAPTYVGHIRALVTTYNEKRQSGVDGIHALAWLMRSMAYLHPLTDSNGRSRLLLLQYELRRSGLSCGTMMYNNNKNIYFETDEVYDRRIREGIRMYERAQLTNFTANPWDDEARAQHVHDFPVLLELEKCWANQNCHQTGGCRGTSVALLDKLTSSELG